MNAILILIDVQYSQEAVKKLQMVKIPSQVTATP